MHCSSHALSAVSVGEVREGETLGGLITPEYHPGPLDGDSVVAADFAGEQLGGAANEPTDSFVSGMPSQRPDGTWSADAAAAHGTALQAGDPGVASRLVDLAIAAAFAGGLGVGLGGEPDGFFARAAALLGGEAGSLGLGGALLVAQVLAGGVAEVGEKLAAVK
jgi:hypothetical protein